MRLEREGESIQLTILNVTQSTSHCTLWGHSLWWTGFSALVSSRNSLFNIKNKNQECWLHNFTEEVRMEGEFGDGKTRPQECEWLDQVHARVLKTSLQAGAGNLWWCQPGCDELNHSTWRHSWGTSLSVRSQSKQATQDEAGADSWDTSWGFVICLPLEYFHWNFLNFYFNRVPHPIIANHISDEGLISRKYKELKLNNDSNNKNPST